MLSSIGVTVTARSRLASTILSKPPTSKVIGRTVMDWIQQAIIMNLDLKVYNLRSQGEPYMHNLNAKITEIRRPKPRDPGLTFGQPGTG